MTVNINLNLYRYFITVMEEHSISKAAIKMGVSQPTVSYNIRELEKDLGESLFDIGKNGILPGDRAVLLYNLVAPLYDLITKRISDFKEKGTRF